MTRRRVVFALCLLLGAASGMLGGPVVGRAFAQPPAWKKAPSVVLVAPEQDSRLPVAREAIEFWNRAFAEIGTPFRLGPVVHASRVVPVSYLRQVSEQIMEGHNVIDLREPIQRLPGDIRRQGQTGLPAAW